MAKGGDDEGEIDMSDVVPCALPEAEVYAYLIVLMYLIDGERGEDALGGARRKPSIESDSLTDEQWMFSRRGCTFTIHSRTNDSVRSKTRA